MICSPPVRALQRLPANRLFALATTWRTKAEHLTQTFKSTADSERARIAKETLELCAAELEELAREM